MSNGSKNYNAQLTAAAASTALHNPRGYNNDENHRTVNSFLGNRTLTFSSSTKSPQYDYLRSKAMHTPYVPRTSGSNLRNPNPVYNPSSPAASSYTPSSTGKRYTLTSASAKYLTKSERQRNPSSYANDFTPSFSLPIERQRAPSITSNISETPSTRDYEDSRLHTKAPQYAREISQRPNNVGQTIQGSTTSTNRIPLSSRNSHLGSPILTNNIRSIVSSSAPSSPAGNQASYSVSSPLQRSSTVGRPSPGSIQKSAMKKHSPVVSVDGQLPEYTPKKRVSIYEDKDSNRMDNSSSESLYQDVNEEFESNPTELSGSPAFYVPSTKRISVIPSNVPRSPSHSAKSDNTQFISLEDAAKKRVEEMLRQMDGNNQTNSMSQMSNNGLPLETIPDDNTSFVSESSFDRDGNRGRGRNLLAKLKPKRSSSKASRDLPYGHYGASYSSLVGNGNGRYTLRGSNAGNQQREPIYSLRQTSQPDNTHERRSYTFSGTNPMATDDTAYENRFVNDSDSMLDNQPPQKPKKKGNKLKAFKKLFKIRF
ncbi:eisosome assembly protein Seg1 [Schizosaccharomyces osmophilus]|uniref:Eisosome assembly protein Seg1 n=1 Tax=Schizosaccharomyces osmophilus TaxID=2545709 RepID=A0AAF0AVG4_9SCHI|nr:eisosome assembly protein Seg1 [Schizosaccharomyces osmophilus]WBW71960.1 eisosome assembly protein Seg1 [Schizosaccharomyces osmophilus]